MNVAPGVPRLSVIVSRWSNTLPHRSRTPVRGLPPYRDIDAPGGVDPRQYACTNYNRSVGSLQG